MTDPNERYSRQMRFAGIGAEGQEKLRQGRVAILGCGALGSGVAQNLGRAGVGYLRIVDRDVLELSNLARQVLFDAEDVRRRMPKAVAAARRLNAINPDIAIEPMVCEISPANVLKLIEGVDLVVDGSDNMETRFLLNDACIKAGRTWVYGGAVGSSGMCMTIQPGAGPCLRCVLEDLPGASALKTCNEVGVLNTLTSTVSALQSNEAIRLLVGAGPNPGLLRFDIWEQRFDRSRVQRRPDCPACGLRRFEFLDAPPASSVRVRGRSQVEIAASRSTPLDLASLAGSLRSAGEVSYNGYVVFLTLPGAELIIFADGRVIVQGVADESAARDLVARYVGA